MPGMIFHPGLFKCKLENINSWMSKLIISFGIIIKALME